MEVALHKHIGRHNNIIYFHETGEDDCWRWIAMELAEGGDLFDKIEADEGVGEDVAHVYFCQLYRGETKLSTTLCGSPPYIAPEVINCSNRDDSYEFVEYVKTNAKPTDELWERLPTAALSLLRGMMKVDASNRFSMDDIRRHPWFTRTNPYMSADNRLSNPINLATTMLESLHIDFNRDPLSLSSQPQPTTTDTGAMEVDEPGSSVKFKFASTQPEHPVDDMLDWDGPPRLTSQSAFSQPKSMDTDHVMLLNERLSQDPSMSQFSTTPSVPLSRTQNAVNFHDIVPASRLTRFASAWPLGLLVPRVCEALQLLHVPASPTSSDSADSTLIRIRTQDDRKCPLHGNIIIESITEGHVEVEFVKVKGDPLEWRRFFKKVAILCKDVVFKPDT
ncbi:serine/threonine protein kinase [Histoplasma capsulatum H143]|uniref:Serine/threonine protein kinase n=1 Tax=Ajellomyces capsulatus (strain H143) TaxID=544712 RepID=C6H6K0_AJECH|nr:serine/threonine protein kinase [Histoplasma capsulatum H143]